MAERSLIEWTDATWNPVTGCTIVSPGCTNCYAMKLAGTRLKHIASRKGLTRDSKAGPVWTGEVRLNEDALFQPLRWREPRMIFVCAHGDLFHESVPDEWIDRVFATMALSLFTHHCQLEPGGLDRHVFQVLTKRSERMRRYVSNLPNRDDLIAAAAQSLMDGNLPVELVERVRRAVMAGVLPNVWLGVSAERQTEADARIPDLLATPAAVRFLSAEPLLGPLDLERVGTLDRVRAAIPEAIAREERGRPKSGAGSISGVQIDAIGSALSSITFFQTPDHMGGFTASSPRLWPRLDWVIAGGESGPAARPMHPDWVRGLRDQCVAAGVPFFFKQWGEWAPGECAATAQTHTEAVATYNGPEWTNPGWHFSEITVRESEELHRDDEPDVWRLGKKRAGRMLDGREWSEMPAARQAVPA